MGKINYGDVKDWTWTIWKNAGGDFNCDQAQLAVLMDIRRELKRMNRLLHCPNFTGIPATLRRISRNTAKPRKRKVKK